MPNFKFWDLKYYYQIHCAKQKAQWLNPVSYERFTDRLKKMNLYDAIHTPRAEYQVRDVKSYRAAPIQDEVRRKQIEKEENIQVLHFDHMKKLENKIQIPKPKQSLLIRFISFLKQWQKNKRP